MGADDDIAAALPRPPLPAPARREAAIAAALRRFDGVDEPAPAGRRPAPPWRRRPYVGALAGAALVALVALPLAWTSLDEQPSREARRPSPAATGAAEGPGPAAADAVPSPPGTAPSPPRAVDSEAPPVPAAIRDEGPAPAPTGAAKTASEPAPVARQATSAQPPAPDATENGELVVTGSRISRPNLSASAPVTVADDSAIVVTGTRVGSARAARRGDWNACTVDDPGRNLEACRASPRIADGLARAWEGDWDGAIKALDSAVAVAPRSSAAYLNRGLAYRRRGELDRALADLDKAVRFSPRSARGYFQRSLLLRQKGDVRRARADEARAVELDPRYGVLVTPVGRDSR